VGRPSKEKVAELLQPTSIPMKPTANSRKKVIGPYQNWFNPILWPPIFTTVKQHRNIQEALDFLKYAYRQSGDLSCVYDHLNRCTMNRWFLTIL
jgi:ferric iron reductase protein FhuF